MVLSDLLESVGVSAGQAMMLVDTLLVAGALNWGLVGVFDYNLVETLLGTGTATTAVYALVGLAGLDRGLETLGGY